MKEAGGGEAGMLIRNVFLFQIFPWGFQMENNLFLDSSKVLLSFLPAVKHISFHFNKSRTIFLMFCCSLSILLSSNLFCTVHLIQMEESNMTRPISAMSRVNLYKELIEVALVLVPRQKLIKTDTTTWKY